MMTRRIRKSRRTRKQKGGRGATVDMVIARYKEDMHWMDTYKEKGFHKIFIYDKSEPKKDIACPSWATNCEVKSIPNVGVCDQTYLYHIVHHYGSLADVTIFAPGSADMDHKAEIIDFTINKVFETKTSVFNTFEFDIGVGEAMYNFTLPTYPTGHTANKDGVDNGEEAPQELANIRPFGAWYAANFPGDQPKKSTFFGLMAISREHIHKKPKSFYEGLLKQISTHKFHEASHFMERSWNAPMHPLPDNCYYASDVFDRMIGIAQGGYKIMRRQQGGQARKHLRAGLRGKRRSRSFL